jgi:bile acid:Na+ symporter, BASS family
MVRSIFSVVIVAVPLTVMLMMLAQGMGTHHSQLAIIQDRPWMILRSLLVVLVVVPLAVIGLVYLLKPSPLVKLGLGILVACPAAPMMMVQVPKQGGSQAYITSLHLSLALLAVVTVPLTMQFIARLIGFQGAVSWWVVARVVGQTILLPVGLGLLLRRFFPKFCDAVGPKVGKIGMLVLYFLVVVMFGLQYKYVIKMDLWSYGVMALVVVLSMAIGHFLGPRNPEERTTLAIESAARHPGLALTIAILSVSREQALRVIIPYLIVFLVLAMAYLQGRKHLFHNLKKDSLPSQ